MRRRTQEERRTETKAALVRAASTLFMERGYDGTSNSEIAECAGLTRGALAHYFSGKAEIFEHVCNIESQNVVQQIGSSTEAISDPLDALVAGTKAYFNAMAEPGRCRLLLLDAPAILGSQKARQLAFKQGGDSLLEGIRAVRPDLCHDDARTLAVLLSASFDAAAISIHDGEDPERVERNTLSLLLSIASSSE